jgi:hypothetical protein
MKFLINKFLQQLNTNILNVENVVCKIVLINSVPICVRSISKLINNNEISVVSHSRKKKKTIFHYLIQLFNKNSNLYLD